jgi:hypothetical protein
MHVSSFWFAHTRTGSVSDGNGTTTPGDNSIPPPGCHVARVTGPRTGGKLGDMRFIYKYAIKDANSIVAQFTDDNLAGSATNIAFHEVSCIYILNIH